MAERTSTRIASRRTTPQPAVATARTTRVTRSQSRDISDNEEVAKGIQKPKKRTRTFTADADVPNDRSNPKRQKGRPANHSRNVQDLSTVLEADPQNDGESEGEQATRNGELNEQTKTLSKSPGGFSAFSGTTARTSLSETGSTKLDKSSGKDQGGYGDGNQKEPLKHNLVSELSDARIEPNDRKKSKKPTPLQLAQFNLSSKKAKDAAAFLKRIETSRKKALAAEHSSPQQSQNAIPNIQVTATAESSTRELSKKRSTGGPDNLPSPAANNLGGQAAEQQGDDSWRPQTGDEEDFVMPADEIQLREVGLRWLSMDKQHQAESNKENIEVPNPRTESRPRNDQKPSFLDPQSGAERVSWKDSQESSQNSYLSQISEDQGFQTQVPPADTAIRRTLKPTSKHPSSQPGRSQDPSRRIDQSQRKGRSPSLEVIPDRANYKPTPSPLDVYREANSVAKLRKTYPLKMPQAQTRRPWSDEETDQLQELIKEYGISWSLLMQEDSKSGNILQDRGQVGLKDKARNMKVDYLKAGRMLPRNFERIPISKLQIDRLRADGIEYDPETGMRVDAVVDDAEFE